MAPSARSSVAQRFLERFEATKRSLVGGEVAASSAIVEPEVRHSAGGGAGSGADEDEVAEQGNFDAVIKACGGVKLSRILAAGLEALLAGEGMRPSGPCHAVPVQRDVANGANVASLASLLCGAASSGASVKPTVDCGLVYYDRDRGLFMERIFVDGFSFVDRACSAGWANETLTPGSELTELVKLSTPQDAGAAFEHAGGLPSVFRHSRNVLLHIILWLVRHAAPLLTARFGRLQLHRHPGHTGDAQVPLAGPTAGGVLQHHLVLRDALRAVGRRPRGEQSAARCRARNDNSRRGRVGSRGLAPTITRHSPPHYVSHASAWCRAGALRHCWQQRLLHAYDVAPARRAGRNWAEPALGASRPAQGRSALEQQVRPSSRFARPRHFSPLP